jgi:hypothetical protein
VVHEKEEKEEKELDLPSLIGSGNEKGNFRTLRTRSF